MKNIIVLFPGIRGEEIPLLYFAGKKYADLGYEVLFLTLKDTVLAEEMMDDHVKCMTEYWKQCLLERKIQDYDNIIFAAKSMGSVCACKINEMLKLNAELILFTPLYQTLPYIHEDNRIKLAAAGTEDKWLPCEVLKEHCIRNQVPFYIEPGVGHRMEVPNDLARNLEIIQNVISRC